MSNQPITFSIAAGENITPGTIIELRAPRPVNPQSAQSQVGLYRAVTDHRINTSISVANTIVKISTANLEPGPYSLRVGELVDTNNVRFGEPIKLVFVIRKFLGRVPDNYRIEHAVTLAIEGTSARRLKVSQTPPDGATLVEILKTTDRNSNHPSQFAFDQQGGNVDADALFSKLYQRRRAKFGRLHEALFNRIAGAADEDRVDIVVWPKIADLTTYAKRADRETKEQPKEEKQRLDAILQKRSSAIAALKKIGADIKNTDGSIPTIHATLKVSQVRQLGQSTGEDNIGQIFIDDTSEVPDLANSIKAARSNLAQSLGYRGAGVKVAVFESGPSNLTDLSVVARYTTSPETSDHARLTHAIIKNVEPNKPHGHAPDCSLYSANSSSDDALRWACSQGCTVISQSFHRDTEPRNGSLQPDDILKDYLATHFPFPTICQAAGNFWLGDPDNITPPEAEYVNHKGYNTLSVGSHDDPALAIAPSSVFRNPTSTHGDRELPEIAANGTDVSALGLTMSGTSFAAPAVAGAAAIIQSVDSILKSWPEGCRAILLAAAGRNVSGSTWWADVSAHVDARDGSGALDSNAAVQIAKNRKLPNNVASERGWDVGTLSSAVVGTDKFATFRYKISVPTTATVKVALAWDSKVTTDLFGNPTTSVLTVDLDLFVSNSAGTTVALSSSFDNSYEIAEFTAIGGQIYNIAIRRWSGTDDTWYGLAWGTKAL